MRIYDPKKICVPVDFSEMCQSALQAAVDIAKKWDAEVKVLHVAKESDYLTATPSYVREAPVNAAYGGLAHRVPMEPVKRLEEVEEELAERVRAMIKEAAAGPGVEPLIRWGIPERTIPQIAETEDFDLIVMATHGRRGLNRFLLGSVTEVVIRRAPCPVLAIRAKAAKEPLKASELAETAAD